MGAKASAQRMRELLPMPCIVGVNNLPTRDARYRKMNARRQGVAVGLLKVGRRYKGVDSRIAPHLSAPCFSQGGNDPIDNRFC